MFTDIIVQITCLQILFVISATTGICNHSTKLHLELQPPPPSKLTYQRPWFFILADWIHTVHVLYIGVITMFIETKRISFLHFRIFP